MKTHALEYCHEDFAPQWQPIQYPHGGTSEEAQYDLAMELASDFSDDDVEDYSVEWQFILDEIEVREQGAVE